MLASEDRPFLLPKEELIWRKDEIKPMCSGHFPVSIPTWFFRAKMGKLLYFLRTFGVLQSGDQVFSSCVRFGGLDQSPPCFVYHLMSFLFLWCL